MVAKELKHENEFLKRDNVGQRVRDAWCVIDRIGQARDVG
jgi:hypothetical protein